MLRLILASQSPHRLELLRSAGYDVEAVPANIDEPDPMEFGDLDAGLVRIAALKAGAVYRRGASGLIFAADTVGVAGGAVLGKPADRADALRMLRAISGTVHEVRTGWCLLRTSDQLQIVGVEKTTIAMREWNSDELAAYLESGQWIGKSGAYGLELPQDPFVTHIAGSASNVVGVPLERLREVLAGLHAEDK
ncbi:MAG TPA: Maf family protein [Planctomycetaceae bacterium]|jgi:septum formation protein